jgi:hypothetical protein
MLHRIVGLAAIAYVALWALTAAVGTRSVRRAALADREFGPSSPQCLNERPLHPVAPVCFIAPRAYAPFIIAVRYGLAGVDSGWEVRQTVLWLLVVQWPLTTSRMEV